jgi:hypothetical protein
MRLLLIQVSLDGERKEGSIKYKYRSCAEEFGSPTQSGLDAKTGLLTGLLTGIQGWKCPVALSQTCYGSKSLKVILMDSNFVAVNVDDADPSFAWPYDDEYTKNNVQMAT